MDEKREATTKPNSGVKGKRLLKLASGKESLCGEFFCDDMMIK